MKKLPTPGWRELKGLRTRLLGGGETNEDVRKILILLTQSRFGSIITRGV